MYVLHTSVHASVCVSPFVCPRLYVSTISPVSIDGFSQTFSHWCILGQRYCKLIRFWGPKLEFSFLVYFSILTASINESRADLSQSAALFQLPSPSTSSLRVSSTPPFPFPLSPGPLPCLKAGSGTELAFCCIVCSRNASGCSISGSLIHFIFGTEFLGSKIAAP